MRRLMRRHVYAGKDVVKVHTYNKRRRVKAPTCASRNITAPATHNQFRRKHGSAANGKPRDHHLADYRRTVLAGGAGMKDLTSYARPDRRPETAQTESGRVKRHNDNGKRVPDYSTAAQDKKR